MSAVTSFRKDIFPLFTELDIEGMRRAFDLTDYEAVKAHAQAICDRIRGIGGTVMPPPPPRGDGPWPQSRIELFDRWVADGCPP
jgi:hypothetical protein